MADRWIGWMSGDTFLLHQCHNRWLRHDNRTGQSDTGQVLIPFCAWQTECPLYVGAL